MLGMLGIKKNIGIGIREKFAIPVSKKTEKLKLLLNEFKECIVLSTCNRTEIYINYDENYDQASAIDKIFEIFGWNTEFKEYTFFKDEEKSIIHLFEVACGYHSKIRGEDQILGQIKTAYKEYLYLKVNRDSKLLERLFENAIGCGKKFRSEAKLFEIPVSSVSIVTNKFIEAGCKKIMVLGYGEMGKLAVKYLLGNDFEKIYLVLRDFSKADDIFDDRVELISFEDKNKYINDIDGLIGCTSAPHAVVVKGDISEEGKKIYCFDMAVPRDIDSEVLKLDRVESYNIDEISNIDDKNKELRNKRIEEYKFIVDDSINEYIDWKNVRNLSSKIREIKENGENIYKRRLTTFNNKKKYTEADDKLVGMLLKSTADVYINRAIELLKEEKLKGREDECLRIINRIFAAES